MGLLLFRTVDTVCSLIHLSGIQAIIAYTTVPGVRWGLRECES